MARTAITPVAIPDAGYNLTDSAGFTALSTGAGNGVEIPLDYVRQRVRLVLKNTTGGAAVYTIKVPAPAEYSAKAATIQDVTVTVAAGKTWLYELTGIFKQSDDAVYVDCDVAGSVLPIIW